MRIRIRVDVDVGALRRGGYRKLEPEAGEPIHEGGCAGLEANAGLEERA